MQKNDAAISFPVIVAAANGDVDAINAVLKRYEGWVFVFQCQINIDNIYYCCFLKIFSSMEESIV